MIDLPELATGEHAISIRLACSGPGDALVTDDADGLVFGLSICDGTAIAGAALTSSPVDRRLQVTVADGVDWSIAVWAE